MRGGFPAPCGRVTRRPQLQLDIYGELMDSVCLYNKYGCPIGYDLWCALGRQLDGLEKHWQLPDDGIRESRGGRHRSTYSALMMWVAFERAAERAGLRYQRLARAHGMHTPARLRRLRDCRSPPSNRRACGRGNPNKGNRRRHGPELADLCSGLTPGRREP
jgi:Glycosyl hydrolases family 15